MANQKAQPRKGDKFTSICMNCFEKIMWHKTTMFGKDKWIHVKTETEGC